MSKSLQLGIPTPCHESWANMQPSEKGRHCVSCQKTVVDFTAMSDQEIIRYMSKAGSHVCGRLAPDQINRPLIPLTPPQQNRLPGWPLLVAGLLFTADKLAFREHVTQGMLVPLEETTPKDSIKKDSVEFTEPRIVGELAAIQIDDPVAKINNPVAKIDNPCAKIDNPCAKIDDSTAMIEDSATKIDLPAAKPYARPADPVPIAKDILPPQPVSPKTDTSRSSELHGLVGAVICTRPKKTDTLKQLITDTLSALRIIPKKQTPVPQPENHQLTIYPNPVRRGAPFRLAWQTDPGKYQVSLFSPSGALIQERMLDISSTKQVGDWQLPTNVPAGIYIVRVIRKGQSGVYARELVVQ
jgi:hypothetical protein